MLSVKLSYVKKALLDDAVLSIQIRGKKLNEKTVIESVDKAVNCQWCVIAGCQGRLNFENVLYIGAKEDDL